MESDKKNPQKKSFRVLLSPRASANQIEESFRELVSSQSGESVSLRKSLKIEENSKRDLDSILNLAKGKLKINMAESIAHPISICFRKFVAQWAEAIPDFELNSENMIWFYPFVLFSLGFC